jgi:enamine deaminase RidA (YjgF/YER057c/UK114 family)
LNYSYFSTITLFLIGILAFTSCEQTNVDPQKEVILYEYDVEEKMSELGIVLHEQKMPPGLKIKMAKQVGDLIYLSGNGPIGPDGKRMEGKVGSDLTIKEGYAAARLTAINHLAILKSEIGDLNRVVNIVKVLGMVNCSSDFTEQPSVINGYSDVMVEVFGERGMHARSAIGVGSLPWNLACEVEAIVQVRSE